MKKTLSWCHVSNTDRHSIIWDPSWREFWNPEHAFGGNFNRVVPNERIHESCLWLWSHCDLSKTPREEFWVLKSNPTIFDAHKLVFATVELFLHGGIYKYFTCSVWSQEYIYHLFTCPKFDRFHDTWRRNFDSLISIPKVRTNSHQFWAVQKHVFVRDKVWWGKEILGCGNQWFSASWNHQIILDIHENSRFSLCLFSLWQMNVHFITIKISIIRFANTLIKP